MMAKTKDIAASDLKGPDWESSDEELQVHEDEDEEKVTEKSSTTKNNGKTTTGSKEKRETSDVVYIGHLPKGCEERELIGFLKQFGRLVQLRVCRSHRTGGVKGYAFAKFENSEVAAIVADTMNGHLLFQKRLICHVVPPERVHNKIFSTENKTIIQRPRQTREVKSLKKMKEATVKLLNNEKKKKKALKAMGIDYDFPGYRASVDPTNTPSSMEEETLEKQEKKKPKQPSAKKSKKSSEAANESTILPVEEMGDKEQARPQSEKKRRKEKKKRRKTN